MIRAAPYVVEHDALDLAALDQIRTADPGFEALARAGSAALPDFGALLADLFFVFYKGQAGWLEPVPKAGRLHRRLIEHVRAAGGFEAARRQTLLDAWSSGSAAQAVGEQILILIRRERLLLDEEVLDAHRLAHHGDELAAAQARLDALDQLKAEGIEVPRSLAIETEVEVEVHGDALDRHAEALANIEIPVSHQSQLRETVDALPRRLTESDADVENFGRGMGVGQRLSADQRFALGRKLMRSEKLRKLSMLVGALRREARVRRKRRIPARGAEIYQITRGADPARLLASELSALRHPILRRDLQRRFLERQVMQYGLRADDDRGRGPMVVCLDGSGSMQGARELWAKAVTLTLLEHARRTRRAFRVIQFSAPPTPIWVRDLVDPRPGVDGRRPADTEAVLEFAEYFPGGGTHFEAPLSAALEALKVSRYRRGDVVFITDGEAQLGAPFLTEFMAEKGRLGFSVLGVLVDVGTVRASTVERFADTIQRVSALTSDAALTVVEAIK